MWIDVHTHLEMIEGNTEEVLAQAKAVYVTHMITIGCHPSDFIKVCDISEKYFPHVAATVGVHPHDAKLFDAKIENQMRELSKKEYVVGLGEMGLDYYYNHSDPQVQRDVFHSQMKMAADLGLPVEIHTRDAEDDTILELKKWKGSQLTGMMHCFSGTQKLADAALEAGFYISLSGVVTFKTAEPLREVVKTVPLDKIFVETDAPFLAPVPLRGKKNVPAFIVHTAEKISELKNISKQDLSVQLNKNVKTLFTKWKF
jgi:TatD DNase family protein